MTNKTTAAAERVRRLAEQATAMAEANTVLRKIAAHVPAKVWMTAKEKSGFGTEVRASQLDDPKVDEAWLQFVTAGEQSPTYADLARELADLKAQAAAFADETPLTPEAVMEMLPGNVEDYGGSMGGDYSSAVGKIAWGWYLSEDPDVGHEFWLQVSSRNVALCELTIGRFRHLLTALAIAPEQK